MSTLSALPNELLARIISFLDKPALTNTRLVSNRFEQLAVEKLFERVSLYAHWRNESDDEQEETYSVDTARDEWGLCKEGERCARCDMIRDSRIEIRVLGAAAGEGVEDEDEWDVAVEEGGLKGEYSEDEDDAQEMENSDSAQLMTDNPRDTEENRARRAFKDEYRSRQREREHEAANRLMNAAEGLRDGNIEVEDEDPWSGALDEPRNSDGREESGVGCIDFWDEEDDREDGNETLRDGKYWEETLTSSGVPHAQWLSRSDPEIRAAEQHFLRHESYGWKSRRKTHPWGKERPQWALDRLPGPPGYDANMFKNILQHETFKKYVKEVHVYTCETDCDHHPAYETKWFTQEWPNAIFDPVFHESIKRLNEFSNMRSITVHFDRHAGDEPDIFQKKDFQRRWLRRILTSINSFATEIAVRHYENSPLPSSEAPLFIENVANVTSLRMSIKHQETNHNAGPTYRCGHIHAFWNRFSDQFLKPPSANLTALVLYSDLPLGWFPKLDLRGVHFPRLHSLTLGHHIFHHEHQVDWILSHHATLEELYLDRCSILYQIGYSIPGWLDEEGYPRATPPGRLTSAYGWSSAPEHVGDDQEFARSLQFTSLCIRWHDIFPRFTNGLSKLHTFKFGSSKQWKMDTASRYCEKGHHSHALPIMPWEDEKNIENRILEERYVIWDDWEQDYRPHWTSRTVTDVWEEMDQGWRKEWKIRLEAYPDCDRDDEDALQALLKKTRGH